MMQAMAKYWAAPDTLVVEAGDPAAMIAWLEKQDVDTWHRVVQSWNYDSGDAVLRWILSRPECDRGTAAQVFLVEGLGHWINGVAADPRKFDDENHICRVVLDHWSHYEQGVLKPHEEHLPAALMARITALYDRPPFEGTAFRAIMEYQGERDAVSKYASEDGKIMVDFNYWAKVNGVTVG
ncbi:DUF4274 domain-containing protein [Primorskyibacter sp. 2E107]|uniref:DUF4274 domain-containing protein n=1 Tax=Primorskyibacter sp. 2E107 TaxID=3403458 RepID=UPI003AF5F6C6